MARATSRADRGAAPGGRPAGAGPSAVRVGAAVGGRRLVVHAGTEKTGSTSLQRVLAALDPVLRERGVHVPMAARGRPQAAHHLNLRYRLARFRYVPENGSWRALVDEIRASDADLFVISDEKFGAGPPGGVFPAIAELAARCELAVDVVAYVRPQCQYLESLYAEHVKNGYVGTPFELYVAKSFAGAPLARHAWLNFARGFDPWRAVCGDRISVTPLEPSRVPDGLVAHFLGLIGAADLADAAPDVRANTRVGAKEVEVRRLTTVALRRAGVREPWLALDRLHRLPELLSEDRPFTGLSAARAEGLMDRFAAVNAAFARNYGISAEGVLFEGAVVDGLARPNVAQWGDVPAEERRAVREYVREVAGVDPAPRSGRRGTSMAGAPKVGQASWLDRVRRDAPIGSLGWRAAWFAAWIVDWRVLRRIVGALVRRAHGAVAAAPLSVDAVFDTDGPGPARDR